MIKIFEHILHHALDSRQQLLSHFLEIVETYGTIVSDKKSILGQDTVTFLGMTLKYGYYSPGPHITQELTHFPDEHVKKADSTIPKYHQLPLGILSTCSCSHQPTLKNAQKISPIMGPLSNYLCPTPQVDRSASSSIENPHWWSTHSLNLCKW